MHKGLQGHRFWTINKTSVRVPVLYVTCMSVIWAQIVRGKLLNFFDMSQRHSIIYFSTYANHNLFIMLSELL